MPNNEYDYNIDDDISGTMHDIFIDALNEHFDKIGPLVISAPKGGGDVFADAEFTHHMGDFVFDRVTSEDGVDTIRGRVTGEFDVIFESVGGLNFEIDITTQGWVRHRFIDAERQVRGFDAWYFDEDLDESAIQQMEERWEAARLK